MEDAKEETPIEKAGNEVGPVEEKKERKVVISPLALIEIYSGDEVATTLHPPKTIRGLVESLSSMDKDAVVSVYVVEDEEHSDPLPEDGKRVKAPILEIEKMTAGASVEKLKSYELTPQQVMQEFQRLCDYLAFRGNFIGVNTTLEFAGEETGGFTFFNPSAKIRDQDVLTLYKSASGQLEQFKAKIREVNPEVQFPGDEPLTSNNAG